MDLAGSVTPAYEPREHEQEAMTSRAFMTPIPLKLSSRSGVTVIAVLVQSTL
jgi:hypothetical protein